jgi:hypothetical protein
MALQAKASPGFGSSTGCQLIVVLLGCGVSRPVLPGLCERDGPDQARVRTVPLPADPHWNDATLKRPPSWFTR